MKPPRDMPPVFFEIEAMCRDNKATLALVTQGYNELITGHNRINKDTATVMILCAGISKIFDAIRKKGLLSEEEIKLALEAETPEGSIFDTILSAAVSKQPVDGNAEPAVLSGSSDAGTDAGEVCTAGTGEDAAHGEGDETPAPVVGNAG